jgi:hypothetical protein
MADLLLTSYTMQSADDGVSDCSVKDDVMLTWSPRLTRYAHRWLPTKPAPPVTSTRLRSTRGLAFGLGWL